MLLCALASMALLLFPAPRWLCAQEAPAEELLDLELRIAIGGGTARQWRGTIGVTNGEVEVVRVLGLEPDTPGSARVVQGQIQFAQRSERTYDGLDIAVRGPRNALLKLAFGTSGAPLQTVEVPLTELIAGIHNAPLDDQQNRILVRRTAGDKLRLLLERDQLVYDTGELVRFSVEPHEANLPTDTALRCRVRLLDVNNAEQGSHEQEFRIDRSGIAPTLGPFELTLPNVEGPYRVAVEIIQPPRLGVSLVRARPLLQRDMQLIAISLLAPPGEEVPWEAVLEIDPAHPGWLERLTRLTKLAAIPGFHQEPISNQQGKVTPRQGTSLVELGVDGWQAYPLPTRSPGLPHLLEVEYPAEAQTLGISIVEPNAAGQVTPLGVDSGVSVTPLAARLDAGLKVHRFVYWPRTKTPLVLLTNRDAQRVAKFGKLRVLAGPKTIPSAPKVAIEPARGRLIAAYYDKPLFAENFGAGEAVDAATGRTLDDWNTFYLGAKRLIEQLKATGYNGAVISVFCEGSTLYPSPLLDPTPKYDMGTFFATGQDPQRKDVLEMLFRLFDREGLQLAPAVQFSSPLVELEELRRLPDEAVGLELVGPDGNTWLAARGTRRGLAPYYNPLDPRVQMAMRRVIVELADRYGHHESFAGVSLQLSPETFAQLPGENWGFDDRTMQRFAQDTKKPVALTGPERYAQRARQLQTEDRAAWLAWRAKQMAGLYTSIERDLVRRRGNARLYLAGGEMLHSHELERTFRPSLPGQTNVREALLAVGLDAQLLSGESNLVLLTPLRSFAPAPLAAQGSLLELNGSLDWEQVQKPLAAPGVHLFHEPATLRLEEFDQLSPFGADKTHLFLAAQLADSGAAARRHLARSIAALDVQNIVQGGWMLPLGQDEALRPLFAVYRQLPAVRFDTVPPPTQGGQPIVCRRTVFEGKTYVYLVNTSAWPVKVKLAVSDPDGGAWNALGGRTLPVAERSATGLTSYALELEPFDIYALRASSARAQVGAWQTSLPPSATEDLRRQIDTLRAKVIALRHVKPLTALPNADFEQPVADQPIPHWIHATGPDLTLELDRADARGQQALHFRSRGAVGWVRSEPIPAPRSGRISVSVWLKTKTADDQPPLRLAIEAQHRGQPYYRFATVGADSAAPLRDQWGNSPYLFHIDDLPTSELTDLRVGFDLMGAGEVWIDDVQVFDLYFRDNERDEMMKMIALADLHLGKGQISQCERMLEGYWARYLGEYVTDAFVAELAKTATPAPAAKPPVEPPPEAASLRDRMWNWVPKWR
jgi:hypothetical protein